METEPAAALARSAQAALGPLGIKRKGRSRTWIADHGWWLLIVEFQPSSWARDLAYLNVGEQHLWVERDHLALELSDRPLGGAARVDLANAEALAALVDAAATVAAERLRAHGEGSAALRRIAAREADDLNAGIAAALLGNSRAARERLGARLHDAYRRAAARYLDALDEGTVDDLAVEMTEQARARLGLPPSDITWRS